MFLALDKNENIVLILHHFSLFRSMNKPPQLAALTDNNHYSSETSSQLVFLQANESCGAVEFSISSKTSSKAIAKLETDGVTLLSPSRKIKNQSTLLLPLPWHCVPFFLEDSESMTAWSAHLVLIHFASSLQAYPVVCAKLRMGSHASLANHLRNSTPCSLSSLKPCRLSPALIIWRDTALQAIFQSIDPVFE